GWIAPLSSSLAPVSRARTAIAAPQQTGPGQQQDEALALIGRARDETRQLDSLTADLRGVLGSDHFTGKLLLKRPNFARVEINSTGSLGSFIVVSDGSTVTTYFKGESKYVQTPAGSTGQYIQGFVAEQVRDFFRPEFIASRGTPTYAGVEKDDQGKSFEVVDVKAEKPGSAM